MADEPTTWPTLKELGAKISKVDLTKAQARGRGGTESIVDGMEPQSFPNVPGLHVLTPQQLLALRLPILDVKEGVSIDGFQRDAADSVAHVRDMARAMLAGKEFPPISVSLDPNTLTPYIGDGGHRGLASIAAGTPIEAVVKVRTFDESKALYANTSKAKPQKKDHLILQGESALEKYLQAAITDFDHPWHKFVGNGKNGMVTPTSAAVAIGTYVHNTINQGVKFHITRPADQFDTAKADELADLLSVFGTKKSNPAAFKATTVRAIAQAAVYIVQRGPQWSGLKRRWETHMPKFQFSMYIHLTGQNVMVLQMVEHWNLKLQHESGHRVEPRNYK